MIRVLIVEDHPAIGEGLRALLEEVSDFALVGTATDLASAARLIHTGRPHVVLCDVMLDHTTAGLDLLRENRGGPAFVMFSAYAYPSNYVAAIEAGAAGYVLKTAKVDEIVTAIRTVAEGGRAFPAALLGEARGARPRPTARHLQIIALVAGGASNAEIAERLSIRPKTVESHLRRLFDRYDVFNRTALARLARDEGWLPNQKP